MSHWKYRDVEDHTRRLYRSTWRGWAIAHAECAALEPHEGWIAIGSHVRKDRHGERWFAEVRCAHREERRMITDKRATLTAQLAAKDEALAEARKTVAFLRSVVLGGERMTDPAEAIVSGTLAAINAALEPKP